MRRTDHERIAEAVASIEPTYFSSSLVSFLKDGSILPDTDGYLKRVAHHKREDRWEAIRAYIFEARKDFLKGNFTRSALHLGVAYHFIADAMCPPSDSSNHRKWESEISRLEIPEVRPAVIPTPAHIDKYVIVKLKEPCAAPYIALKTSIELCAGLMKLTWRPLHERTLQDEQVIKTSRTAKLFTRLLKLICAGAVIAPVVWLGILWFLLALIGISISFIVIDELCNAKRHRQIIDWYRSKQRF